MLMCFNYVSSIIITLIIPLEIGNFLTRGQAGDNMDLISRTKDVKINYDNRDKT